ncbi:MAG: TolC family protein [Bacteroidetes bacterium]|nr:TolC family protein [Bacteroidota bacterium]
MNRVCFFTLIFTYNILSSTQAQVLTLKEAVQTALSNYGTLKAKANYLNASKALVKATNREYLPDLNIAAQQDYGTVNGQNGPLYGFKGFATASAGPPLPTQNWNAAFGALYVANINWDFFAFGRSKERIKVAQSELLLNTSDLEQEKFQHQVRVSAAYLNLLAAQLISRTLQNNLDRATALRNVVVTRTKNGLNPGVDSSLANAEVSNAVIALTNAKDFEQQQSNELAQLMGTLAPRDRYILDTFFVMRIPKGIYDSSQLKKEEHPLLKYYQSRIGLSDERAKYFHTFSFPVFSLFGIIQGRGSGFDDSYGAQNLFAYSHEYWNGIEPTRANYLVGIGMSWNLTTPWRVQQQVAAQHFISRGLQDEYDLASQNISNQLILSDSKIKNAIANYIEAPTQVKAASDAYTQKTVMYKNGLSNIVDVTQALFALNRAETDRDIANNNVWQALLLKAAASGDFGLFMKEF